MEAEDSGSGEIEDICIFIACGECGGEFIEERQVSDDEGIFVYLTEFVEYLSDWCTGSEMVVGCNSGFGGYRLPEDFGGLFGTRFSAVPYCVDFEVLRFEQFGDFAGDSLSFVGKMSVRVFALRFCLAVPCEIEFHNFSPFDLRQGIRPTTLIYSLINCLCNTASFWVILY